MGRQPRNQTEKNWLMDWQSTQKIKDPKSVIFDQVAVVKPISGICGYCGGEFSYQKLTRDHIVPVSQGGRDLWMNVVTCCRLWPPKNLPVGCVSEFRIRSREKNPVGGTRGHHQFGLRVRGRV